MPTSEAGSKFAPTLGTSCPALPPEGALAPWGGPAGLNTAPALGTSCPAHSVRGFTLLELLVVVAIIAIASAGVSFAIRDSAATLLERDAQRLAALLESARAQSRASGVPVRWSPTATGFKFEGARADSLPEKWLSDTTQVVGTASLQLGPDPIIPRQDVVLANTAAPGRTLHVATDGLHPFAVTSGETQ